MVWNHARTKVSVVLAANYGLNLNMPVHTYKRLMV